MNTPNKQAELEKEIKELDIIISKHGERDCCSNWDEIWTCMTKFDAENKKEIIQAELKGIKEGKKINEDIVIKSKEAFDNLYKSCLEEREQIENNAKTQAISEFKEKLKKYIKNNVVFSNQSVLSGANERMLLNEFIDKTAQEIK